jgi:hypothetical protein
MNNSGIRTLGLYQPFAALMMVDKIETRWVRKGRKPPFPLGKYVIYSTQRSCTPEELEDWCGDLLHIVRVTVSDLNRDGVACCVGLLHKIEPMTGQHERLAYVKFKGEQVRKDKHGKEHTYVQWCLHFKDMRRFEQFDFKGKQGVGFFPDHLLYKIQ